MTGYRDDRAAARALSWERHQHARRAVQSPWMRPDREPVADYRPDLLFGAGGLAGILDEMVSGHPKIARAVADMHAVLGSLTLEVQPLPDETQQDAELRQAVADHLPTMGADIADGLTGMGSVMASMVTWYTHGIYAAELRWADTGDGLAIEAYPIHPSSIYQWQREGDRLSVIRQRTQEGSADIPADRCVWVQRGGVVGQYGGSGWLRPLVAPFGLWRALMTLTRRNVALHGGTVEVQERPGMLDADRQRLVEALTAWQVEGAPWVISPHGTQLTFHAPGSGALDPGAMLAHLDAYIDEACGRAASSLAQAAHATRALGEVLSDITQDIAARELHTLLQGWVGGVARWLARELGLAGRPPVLALAAPPMERDEAADVPAIVAAHGAGLLGPWSDTDAAAMRDRLGLPAGAGAGPAAPDAPAAAPAPDAPAPAPAMRDHATCGPGCGCGSVRMGARPLLEVQDVTGRMVWVPRPLVGVERYVAWGDTRDERARLDEQTAAALEAVAEEHRAAIRRALSGPDADPARLEAIRAEYTTRYQDAVEDGAARMQAAVQRWTLDEADRQARAADTPAARGVVTEQGAEALQDSAQDALRRLRVGVALAGQDIAQRVQSEMERWWVAGAGWGEFVSEVNLLLPVRQVMQTVESDARVWVAADMQAVGLSAEMGLQIVGVLRTSVNDGSRCERCESKDGTEYDLPGEQRQWERDPVPDPLCAGGPERCRCGWLVVWGRVDDAA